MAAGISARWLMATTSMGTASRNCFGFGVGHQAGVKACIIQGRTLSTTIQTFKGAGRSPIPEPTASTKDIFKLRSRHIIKRDGKLRPAPSGTGSRGGGPAPADPVSVKYDEVVEGPLGGMSSPDSGLGSVVGYATAESYDLYTLADRLDKQAVYEAVPLVDELVHACLCVRPKYRVDGDEAFGAGAGAVAEEKLGSHKSIFFFADGSVVFWGVPELERGAVLAFLRHQPGVQDGAYDVDTVNEESEQMVYRVEAAIPQPHQGGGGAPSPHNVLDADRDQGSKSRLDKNGTIRLYDVLGDQNPADCNPSTVVKRTATYLEKYTFSNAMAASVKLGVLESMLDRIIDSIEFITEDMKMGRSVKISRHEVLKKTGEIYALRHVLNLSSDILDTPDFYWDRESLETIYHSTCAHLTLGKRTRLANEKISHCCELVGLVTSHLNDEHHVRLEWFIIVLIMIEVFFELLHFAERFV